MKKLFLLLSLLSVFGFCHGQAIHIKASDTTICIGTRVVFQVTDADRLWWHLQWKVNRRNVGGDSPTYITDTLRDGDTVCCARVNNMRDTVYAISDSIVMTVDTTIPDAGIITGPEKVCIGTQITLSDTVTGGIWGVTNNRASVINGVVTGVGGFFFECAFFGDDTVFYVVNNLSCADTAFHVMTTIPQPYISVDLRTPWICPSALPGDIFYKPACYSSYFFVKTDSTKYETSGYIYLISSNECGIDTARYFQKVTYYSPLKDTPVISIAAHEVCVGSKVKISAPIGNYSSIWRIISGSASIVSDSSGVYVQGTNAGPVTLTLQYTNICGPSHAKPDTAHLLINPQPEHDPYLSDICIGKSDTLTDSITGGIWTSSNTSIAVADASKGIITGLSEGRATISYMLPSGCYGTRKVAIGDCTHDLEVYPNPAHDELLVRLSADEQYSSYTIISTIGQVLRQQALKNEYTIINIQTLPRGMYLLRLSGNAGNHTVKFQKN